MCDQAHPRVETYPGAPLPVAVREHPVEAASLFGVKQLSVPGGW